MALAPGARLGRYELIDSLGAGGMGEVYRARDTKLGREVAVKVVLEAFLADRERLARFEREAKALAALNHPNIATLHGMEEADGRHFLVMEMVDGLTLAELLARRGGLALERALSFAIQIADALEAAHEKGVVHRDLKPANVKITPDDKVKVLDFGLAKTGTDAGSGDSAMSPTIANSPTLTAMGTQAGMILGTASYMSPEQARGMSGDHRSDVFSFGVVLYEMLTARQPFQGETVSDVLASVLAREPDLAALPKDLSPRLAELVTRCLEKHPRRRWQAMGDVRHELEVIGKNPRRLDADAEAVARTAEALAAPRSFWRRALPVALTAVVAVAATAVAFIATRPAPVLPDPIVVEIPTQAAAPTMALSPDGRHVVYTTLPSESGGASIWLRSLASSETRPIPGTDRVLTRTGRLFSSLAWSPNSREVAYASSNGLHSVDVVTGQTTDSLKLEQFVLSPGAWSRDGTILYGRRSLMQTSGAGVWRISHAGGGTPVQVTEFQAGDVAQRPSGFLPDGRRFLYVSLTAGTEGVIRMGSIDRKPAEQDYTPLLTADGAAVYAPPGYLLFVKQGAVMARGFDADRGVLLDTPPVQLASGAGPNVLASANGRLLYRAGLTDELTQQSEILRVDRKGNVLTRIGPPAIYGDVNVLPDGVRISINRSESTDLGHLYVVDPTRGAFTRLNPGTATDYAAAISPDSLVAFTYSPEGVSRDIYVRPASGVGDARMLVTSPNVKHPNSWTPDGRFLIYDEHVPGHSQDLMMVRREGGTPIPLLATEADETFAIVSPDGKWLAYRSADSGKGDVYVRDFYPDRTSPFGSERLQVSVAGGDKPRWRHDGREIYFRQGQTVMAVSVQTAGSTLKFGIPVPLFDFRPGNYIPYDVLPDGTFVTNSVVASAKPAAPATLRVLLNWETLIRK
jgi:Tol biopolymer transport system component